MNQLTLKERHELKKIEDLRRVLKEELDKESVSKIENILSELKNKIGVFESIPVLKNAYEAALTKALEIFGERSGGRGILGGIKDFFKGGRPEDKLLKQIQDFTKNLHEMFSLVVRLSGEIKGADEDKTVQEILERSTSSAKSPEDSDPKKSVEKITKEAVDLLKAFNTENDENKKKDLIKKLNLSKNTIKERLSAYKDIISKPGASRGQKEIYGKSIEVLERLLAKIEESSPESESSDSIEKKLNSLNLSPENKRTVESLKNNKDNSKIQPLWKQLLDAVSSGDKTKIDEILAQSAENLKSIAGSEGSGSGIGDKIKNEAIGSIKEVISKVEKLEDKNFKEELLNIPGFRERNRNIVFDFKPQTKG